MCGGRSGAGYNRIRCHTLFSEDDRAMPEYPTDFGPYVLLETDRRDRDEGRSYFFHDPVRILRLTARDDPRAFFEAIDDASASGLWVAGYFAYELGYLLEPKLASLLESRKPPGPLAWVGLFENPSLVPSPGGEPFDISDLEPNTSSGEYESILDRIKSRIVEGDTYQVNFTFKQTFQLNGSPRALFEALRRRQSVAYAACLFDGERAVVSLSPELFFEREGGVIRVKPMKGTVHRGVSESEDERLASWLAGDAKNRAENVMIVDMVRNDLGRIALPGGVSVPSLFEIERFETVHQMTSTVEAAVPRETRWFDVFRSLFPCASVTGAPKIRTMELIAQLEKEPRGVYTGAIGYIAPGGDACFNVAIRSVVVEKNGVAQLGIGSGVVFDSVAMAEYDECLLKGTFLTGAIPAFELVETMRMDDGTIYLLDRHMDRLRASATHFGFELEERRIASALETESAKHPSGRHRVRLLVGAGGGVSVSCTPLHPMNEPLRVVLSPKRVSPSDEFLYHKTTHRPLYQRERETALSRGYDEVVFFNWRGECCEGSITNLFVGTDGGLFTPPVGCGLLPGTLRADMLSRGVCRERVITLPDLRRASRVYVGNSVIGLVPAVVED